MVLGHHVQELLEPRSLEVLARESRITDDRDLTEIAQGRVGAQFVDLALDRESLFGLLLS